MSVIGAAAALVRLEHTFKIINVVFTSAHGGTEFTDCLMDALGQASAKCKVVQVKAKAIAAVYQYTIA